MPAAPTTGDATRRKASVLVIDDMTLNREFVARVLEEHYLVITAEGGEQGWELVQDRRPDLVLTDLRMPVLDGLELLHRMRARQELRDVPVIVFTGSPSYQVRLELLRGGAQDFIAKPFSAEELQLRVQTFVELKQARDTLRSKLHDQTFTAARLAEDIVEHQTQLEHALAVADRARDEAEKRSAYQRRLLHMVSHELRTPLAAIQFEIERLLEHAAKQTEPKGLRLARAIQRSSKRLGEVVEVLLSHAQLDAQRVAVVARPIDLPALAAEVLEMQRPRAAEKGLSLSLVVPEPVRTLCSDARLVRLVTRNLVGNAVRYTMEGKVEVRVRSGARGHTLTVIDTGPGILPEDRARAFEPYERLGQTDADPQSGVGLGLALVHQLVRALSGRVELATGPERCGSMFTVVLPDLPLGAVN